MKFYGDYREIAEKSGVQVEKRDTAKIISFTPYIYNECSANCRFCSERLSRNGKAMICRNVCGDYRERLKNVLDILSDRDVFLSLSGKEPTESPEMLGSIAETVLNYKNIGEKVMYSNLSGFCKYDLKNILDKIGLTRIECSRHHFDENVNNSIMCFNRNEKIKYNGVFTETVRQLSENFNMRMVCVFQKTGISDYQGIKQYLDFARSTGISDVVFRELAVFDKCVDMGNTAEYIIKNRIDLSEILSQLDEREFILKNIVQGYYYYSFEYEYRGMKVCFEMSDYEEMEKRISENHLQKLILYPDGKLCMNWNMMNEVDINGIFENG